jgi:SAM-dependent methyltransferase
MTEPANAPAARAHYDASYRNFHTDLYAEIRREANGDDLGQTSWTTADEQDRFLHLLNLSPTRALLDVACGSGGPALRIAERTGCSLVGIDVHDQAISAAKTLAAQRGVSQRAEFLTINAAFRLPFPESCFDAITCIDAINHLPDRPRILAEWARILKPGGRLLFTDPTTITGPLTREELLVRSSIGFFLFVPPEYDRRILGELGLQVLTAENVTANMALLAERRASARAKRSAALRQIEGDASFEAQQLFFGVAARIAREGRLSRFLYASEKAG